MLAGRKEASQCDLAFCFYTIFVLWPVIKPFTIPSSLEKIFLVFFRGVISRLPPTFRCLAVSTLGDQTRTDTSSPYVLEWTTKTERTPNAAGPEDAP